MSSSTTARNASNVRTFRSAAELDVGENLTRLIDKARHENPIGVADWNAARWEYPRSSRASSASEGGLRFTLRSANAPNPGVMPEPFMSFVKAIVCVYNQRTTGLYACGQSQTIIAAARLLYDQVADRGGDPGFLRHGDFDAAIICAKENMGDGAVNVGSKLVIIAEEMDRHRLTAMPIKWRSPLRREHKHDRTGDAATSRRHDKLPSPAVLDALADISSRDDLSDRNLVVQRAVDILFCTGFRLNELLTLPRNTWIEEPILDDSGMQALDSRGRPAVRVGLRYWPEKGGHKVSQIKWLPTAVVDVARRAVEDILRITAPFHLTALQQARKPGTTLLGEPWDSLPPDHLLTMKDVAKVVGLKTDDVSGGSSSGNQFATRADLPMVTVRPPPTDGGQAVQRSQMMVHKRHLEAYLWSRSLHGNALNAMYQLNVAECLFLVPLFFVKRSLDGGLRGTVTLLSDAVIQVHLGSQANGLQPSVFERLGFRDEEGQPLRMTSHQFRHLLSTMAQETCMSEMEIARWMGRANLAHNSAYDHVNPSVRAKRLRERVLAGDALGPVAEAAASIRDPIRREEFVASAHQAAHETDLGLCVHPLDAMPCTEFEACAKCSENRIVKGDAQARERTAELLRRTERLIDLAEAEAEDGTYGADNWLEAQLESAEALRRTLAVHDDESIADGTIVQLSKLPTTRRVTGRRG